MDELRLDYFLSKGLKLVTGDTSTSDIENQCFIVSFAQRKNTGEQPCGDDVPVIINGNNGYEHEYLSKVVAWDRSPEKSSNGAFYAILTWKPDLDALIKMQIEHDDGLRKKRGKTVVDAVNYYQADIYPVIDGSIYKASKVGYFPSNINEPNHELICTIEEFNQCVEEMSVNGDLKDFERYLIRNKFDVINGVLTKANSDYSEYESNSVKPSTKIEYVNVTVKEAKEFHVDELFFYWGDDNYVALKDVDSQTFIINQHKLRRKVETEIKTEKRWVVVNVKNNSVVCVLYSAPPEVEMGGFQQIEITVEVETDNF